MDDYCKRSGQIPAFGNWDYSNELPITQYFECARQAGLIRYSSSSGESDPYIRRSGGGGGDLYAVDGLKKGKGHRNVAHPRKLQTRVREKRGAQVKDQNKRQQVVKKVCDVTEPPRKPPPHFNNNNKLKHHNEVAVAAAPTRPLRPPKAVDEDLYKIPPELLHSSKRKKAPGFFSCLVPACAS